MKNEKGMTIVALILYIMLFSTTIALLASLSGYVYSNMSNFNSNSVSSEEFNKFNVHFVKDVKEHSSVTVTSSTSGDGSNGTEEVTITFTGSGSEGGNKYTYKPNDKAIYKNKEKIASNIVYFKATPHTPDTTATPSATGASSKNTIEIEIKTGKDATKPNFTKTIKYVLKYW